MKTRIVEQRQDSPHRRSLWTVERGKLFLTRHGNWVTESEASSRWTLFHDDKRAAERALRESEEKVKKVKLGRRCCLCLKPLLGGDVGIMPNHVVDYYLDGEKAFCLKCHRYPYSLTIPWRRLWYRFFGWLPQHDDRQVVPRNPKLWRPNDCASLAKPTTVIGKSKRGENV